jgi:hypothetical protein
MARWEDAARGDHCGKQGPSRAAAAHPKHQQHECKLLALGYIKHHVERRGNGAEEGLLGDLYVIIW